MALRPCKECGDKISTEAEACPRCGAKQPKPTSRWTILIGGLFAIFVAKSVFTRADAPSAPPPPEPTAEQKAATAKGDREINIVLNGANWLKSSMKKPETFKLLKAGMIDGKVICYEYQARNSFNDVTTGRHVISDTVNSGSDEAWNKFCAGKSATDYTSVRAVMQ